MLLFTKHSHRYCHSRSKSTGKESVSNNTTYDILCISISGLRQITFQLLCFCRQERKLLNDLVQIGQSCVITGKHLPTFQCFKHHPSPCSLVGNGQLKAEMLQPFMSLVLVFINSLAKVEMLWGVLKVVSGMFLLFSLAIMLYYQLTSAWQDSQHCEQLWGKQCVILLKPSVPVIAFCEQFQDCVTAPEHIPLLYFSLVNHNS